MNNWLLGIDLGTSGLKAVLVRDDGQEIFIASQGYHFDVPVAGFAEQNPDVWWQACCGALRELRAKYPDEFKRIRALSFSGQMHGLVALDVNGNVIRPAILHCDTRSGVQVRELEQRLLLEEREKLFNPVYTGFLLVSLLWIRENEPENYARIAHVMLPKDYLVYRMTGRFCTDISDASATLAFDIAEGKWAFNVLERLGFDTKVFPKCLATTEAVGSVSQQVLDATGLDKGVAVVVGGGDQVMQAIGNGAIRAGDACVNIGTSGQVSFQTKVPIKNPAMNTNTFCGFERGRWYTMGAIMNAGLSYRWFTDTFKINFDELETEVAQANPCGVVFFPWLTGERTPYLNPNLSGGFLGLHAGTGRGAMARAVMEGVAFELRQCLDLCAELGLTADCLIASGGANNSPTWLQIQADVYNLPLKISETREQAGLGAAIAAGVGVGVYASLAKGCQTLVKYRDGLILPNADRHEFYNKIYGLFREFYAVSHGVIERLTVMGRGLEQVK